MKQNISYLKRLTRRFVDERRLKQVVRPLYRTWSDLLYRAAGDVYEVEVGGSRALFLIPTRNEWTDFRNISERPVLEHLLANVRPDDVFYDIGANLGLYSCLVAGEVDGPVFAFEPHPANADRLEENAEINGANVSVFRYALADAAGEAELTVTLDGVGSAGHSLLSHERDGSDSIPTTTERGDEFIARENLPHPTVLKIDVEGAEHDVLEGLASTLSRPECRLVYCETHGERLAAQGTSHGDVRETLESHGFTVTEQSVRNGKGETMLVASKSDEGRHRHRTERAERQG